MTDEKLKQARELYDRWVREIESSPEWWQKPSKERNELRKKFYENRLKPLVEGTEDEKAYAKLLTPSATRKFFTSLGQAAQEATAIPALTRAAAIHTAPTQPFISQALSELASSMQIAKSPAQQESFLGSLLGGIVGTVPAFMSAEGLLARAGAGTAGARIAQAVGQKVAPKTFTPAIAEGVESAGGELIQPALKGFTKEAERLTTLAGAAGVLTVPHVLAGEAPLTAPIEAAASALAGFGPAKIRYGLLLSTLTRVGTGIARGEKPLTPEFAKDLLTEEATLGVLRGAGLVQGRWREYQNKQALQKWLVRYGQGYYAPTPIDINFEEIGKAVAARDAEAITGTALRTVEKLEKIAASRPGKESFLEPVYSAYEQLRDAVASGNEEALLKAHDSFVMEAHTFTSLVGEPPPESVGILKVNKKSPQYGVLNAITGNVRQPIWLSERHFIDELYRYHPKLNPVDFPLMMYALERIPPVLDPVEFYSLPDLPGPQGYSPRALYVAREWKRQQPEHTSLWDETYLAKQLDLLWSPEIAAIHRHLVDDRDKWIDPNVSKTPPPKWSSAVVPVRLYSPEVATDAEGRKFYTSATVLQPGERGKPAGPDVVYYNILTGRVIQQSTGAPLKWEEGVRLPPQSLAPSVVERALQDYAARLMKEESLTTARKADLWNRAMENARYHSSGAFVAPVFAPAKGPSLETSLKTPRSTWYTTHLLVRVGENGRVLGVDKIIGAGEVSALTLEDNQAVVLYRPLSNAFEVVRQGNSVKDVAREQDLLRLVSSQVNLSSLLADYKTAEEVFKKKPNIAQAIRRRVAAVCNRLGVPDALNTGIGVAPSLYVVLSSKYTPRPPEGANFVQVSKPEEAVKGLQTHIRASLREYNPNDPQASPIIIHEETLPYFTNDILRYVKVHGLEQWTAPTLDGKETTFYVVDATVQGLHRGSKTFDPSSWQEPRGGRKGVFPWEHTNELDWKPYVGGLWACIKGGTPSWIEFTDRILPKMSKVRQSRYPAHGIEFEKRIRMVLFPTPDYANARPTDLARLSGADAFYIPGHIAKWMDGWDVDSLFFMKPDPFIDVNAQPVISRKPPEGEAVLRVNTVTGAVYKGNEELSDVNLPATLRTVDFKKRLPWDQIPKETLLQDLQEVYRKTGDTRILDWLRNVRESASEFPFQQTQGFYMYGYPNTAYAAQIDILGAPTGLETIFRERANFVESALRHLYEGKPLPPALENEIERNFYDAERGQRVDPATSLGSPLGLLYLLREKSKGELIWKERPTEPGRPPRLFGILLPSMYDLAKEVGPYKAEELYRRFGEVGPVGGRKWWEVALRIARGLYNDFWMVIDDPNITTDDVRKSLESLGPLGRAFVVAEPLNKPQDVYKAFHKAFKELQFLKMDAELKTPAGRKAFAEKVDTFQLPEDAPETLVRALKVQMFQHRIDSFTMSKEGVARWHMPTRGYSLFAYDEETGKSWALPAGARGEAISASKKQVVIRYNWETQQSEVVAGNPQLADQVRVSPYNVYPKGVYVVYNTETRRMRIHVGHLGDMKYALGDYDVIYEYNPFYKAIGPGLNPIFEGRGTDPGRVLTEAAIVSERMPEALPLSGEVLDEMFNTFTKTVDSIVGIEGVPAEGIKKIRQQASELYRKLTQNVIVTRFESDQEPQLSPKEVEYALLTGQLRAGKPGVVSGKESVDVSNPLEVVELFQRKGLNGVWDSTSGKFMVQVSDGSFQEVPIDVIRKMPEAGDLIGSDIVLSVTGYPDFYIFQTPEGKYKVVEKQELLKSSALFPTTPRELGEEEIADILTAHGYKLSHKVAEGAHRGQYLVLDLSTGQWVYKTPEQVQEVVKQPTQDFTPEVQVPKPPQPKIGVNQTEAEVKEWVEEEPLTPYTFGPQPPTRPEKLAAVKTFPRRLKEFLMSKGTPRTYFAEVGARLKLPLGQMWNDIDSSAIKVEAWVRQHYKTMGEIARNVKRSRRGVFSQYLMIGSVEKRAAFAKENQMTAKELEMASKARQILREAIGENYQDFLTNDIPAAVQVLHMKEGEIPPALVPWIKYGLRVDYWYDGFKLLDTIVHARCRMMVGPAIKRAAETLKGYIKEGKIDPDTARTLKKVFASYTIGLEQAFSGDLAHTTATVEAINKVFGLELTGNLPSALSNALLWSIYSSTMAYRPGLALRNALQNVLTLTPYVGFDGLRAGYKGALTAEGMAWAAQFDCFTQQHVPLEEFVQGKSLVPARLKELYETGMIAYKGAEGFTRAVSANAAKYLWEKYFPKFTNGEISLKEFRRYTGLSYLNKAMQAEVLRAVDAGDTTNALKAYTKALIDDTLWVYRPGNAPLLFRSAAGRLFGQFGTWSFNYVDWARRAVAAGREDPAATMRFVAYWYAVNAGLDRVGKDVLGVDLSPWILTAPFQYAGGPALELALSAREYIEGTPAGKARAASAAKRTMRSFIPFGGLYKDISDVLGAEDFNEALAEFLGVRKVK